MIYQATEDNGMERNLLPFFLIYNMQVKAKGLKLDICTNTGNVLLTYHYPISARHYGLMAEIATLHNCKMECIKNRYFVVLKEIGTSTAVISKFRIVQNQLMLQSREAKIANLQHEVQSLKRRV
jgi:hypothetical protein